LLRAQFPQATVIDLLDEELFLRLQARPVALRDLLPRSGTVVIDEIQRVPALLNEVHLQIEKNRGLRFILTGSSARKLRQKGVNLLGGRARSRRLHPFVWAEIREQFDLSKVLLHGNLRTSTHLRPAPRGAWMGWNRVMPEVVRGTRTENAEFFADFRAWPSSGFHRRPFRHGARSPQVRTMTFIPCSRWIYDVSPFWIP
jgi:hypothetical protein